jgi:glutamate synthase (ferredoxin)
MIQRHVEHTGSERGRNILKQWDQMTPKFVKVLPKDYKRVLEATQRVTAAGLSGEEAIMAAFEQNVHDLARVGGN